MLFKAKSERGQKELKWLLENKMDFIKGAFGQFRVQYDDESGLPQELVARPWDRPFTDFVLADEEQKLALARKVEELNTGQDWQINDLLKECTIE